MNNLYVGKVFELKNVRSVPWYSHNTTTRYQRKDAGRSSGDMTLNEMGKSVLIVEERTKRVKIITKNQQLVWIAKYYLAKEVYADTEIGSVNDALDACITKLSKLANQDDMDTKSQEKLFELVVSVRNIKDSLEKE